MSLAPGARSGAPPARGRARAPGAARPRAPRRRPARGRRGGDPRAVGLPALRPVRRRRRAARPPRRQASSSDPLFLAVVDARPGGRRASSPTCGSSPSTAASRSATSGSAPPLQRTPAATETIYLLARHAFDDLGNRRLEWKCDAANARSRRAAERFGFTFEGVFRQHMIVKGRNRDTAWFSILDSRVAGGAGGVRGLAGAGELRRRGPSAQAAEERAQFVDEQRGLLERREVTAAVELVLVAQVAQAVLEPAP